MVVERQIVPDREARVAQGELRDVEPVPGADVNGRVLIHLVYLAGRLDAQQGRRCQGSQKTNTVNRTGNSGATCAPPALRPLAELLHVPMDDTEYVVGILGARAHTLTGILRPDDGVEAALAVHLVVHDAHLAVGVQERVLPLYEVAAALLPAVVDHAGHGVVHGVLVLVVHVLRGEQHPGEEGRGRRVGGRGRATIGANDKSFARRWGGAGEMCE